MTRVRFIIGALAAVFAAVPFGAAGPAEAQETRLEVDLKPREAEIGDRVEADITLTVPAGWLLGDPIYPAWEETWGEAEIVEAGPVEALTPMNGMARYRQTVALTVFRTGELTLPPVSVELPTAEALRRVEPAQPTVLNVRSVLPEGEENPEPKPPAPPRPLPIGDAFWWSVALGGAACLLAAGWLLRRRLAPAGQAEREVLSPIAALQRDLAGLAETPVLESRIAGLSLYLRRYLGRVFEYPMAESTTTEIRRELNTRALPATLVGRVDELFRSCDRIKFAHELDEPVDAGTCDAGIAAALSIGSSIEEILRPPADEDADEAGEQAA